jgi:hypothetical protein
MKKIVAGLILVLTGVSAQAELCVIDPTSSRYHVDTYIRNQTRCVTTAHAGGSGSAMKALGTTATFLAVVVAGVKIAQYIDNNKEENQWTYVRATWTDGEVDYFKVHTIEITDAMKTVRGKFANAATPIAKLEWVSYGIPKDAIAVE